MPIVHTARLRRKSANVIQSRAQHTLEKEAAAARKVVLHEYKYAAHARERENVEEEAPRKWH